MGGIPWWSSGWDSTLHTADRCGGVTSVCSLIWELVSHTLLSVVKENKITWGTLKISHFPHQKKENAQLLTQKCQLSFFVITAQIFFFSRSPSDSNGQPEMGNISFSVSLQQSWWCFLNGCLLQWGHREDPE